MKSTALLSAILIFGYSQVNAQPKELRIKSSNSRIASSASDKEKIQKTVRQTLVWADSNPINLLPVITDRKNKVVIGLDADQHKKNIDKIKATGFFSTEFIANYNKIILTLDKGIKDGRYGQWLVGDLPIFGFASNTSPWCSCQDVPYDKPNPYSFTKIRIISLDNSKGEANWQWGNLPSNDDSDWKKFTYRFRVVKENGKWKIAYLEGFDFKKAVRKEV